MYRITAKGRDYASQSPMLEALLDGPTDFNGLLSATGLDRETLMQHLSWGFREGLIEKTAGVPTEGVTGDESVVPRFLITGR